jgi:aminoglycoside phosphotransferase (APT) family kinase protein
MGRASDVTDLGDGTVLRVGGSPEREARIMALARSAGYPVPRVHEVRDGALVLKRVVGPTMGNDMARHPWRIGHHVRTLVDLHSRLHAIPYQDGTLLHFDLHPDNVLISRAGPIVIDWTNAHAGEPDSDVAMTWLILATSAGRVGRVIAWLFASRAGRASILSGLEAAKTFRLGDPNVTPIERTRVGLAWP